MDSQPKDEYGVLSNLFRDEAGHPIKFFIQRDLPDDLKRVLETNITVHGGRVEAKVPIAGYILVKPDSDDGRRLQECWAFKPDRPARHVLPYTCVQASIKENRLFKPVFVLEGQKIPIHIHSSVTSPRIWEQLISRIYNAGGDPFSSFEEASVIIADERSETFKPLSKEFDHYANRFVESIIWVRECLEKGVCEHTTMVKKRVGGRQVGAARREYTTEDDSNLALFIAQRIPYKQTGGRTGNKMYQELCTLTHLYPWADRHSWQSWRERYRKNQERFDRLIDVWLEENPPLANGKGQYGYVRKDADDTLTKKKRVARKKKLQVDSETEEEADSDVENDPIGPSWENDWEIKVGTDANPPRWVKELREKTGKGKRKSSESGPDIVHDHGSGPLRKKARLVDDHQSFIHMPPDPAEGNRFSDVVIDPSLQAYQADNTDLEYQPVSEPHHSQHTIISPLNSNTSSYHLPTSKHPTSASNHMRPSAQAQPGYGEKSFTLDDLWPDGRFYDDPRAGSREDELYSQSLEDESQRASNLQWNLPIGEETQALLDDEPGPAFVSENQRLKHIAPVNNRGVDVEVEESDEDGKGDDSGQGMLRLLAEAITTEGYKHEEVTGRPKDSFDCPALTSISREFRFMVEEVEEEYKASGGDLEATRSLFSEMRKAADLAKRMRTAQAS